MNDQPAPLRPAAPHEEKAATRDGRTKLFELATAVFGLISAVLIVVTSVLGVSNARNSNDKDAAQDKNGQLTQQIQAKQSQLDDLNNRLSAAQSALASAGIPVPPTGGAGSGTLVKAASPLKLSLGYCADLDTLDKNWHVTNNCTFNGDAEIENENNNARVFVPGSNDADFAIVDASAPVAYATCAAATAYATEIIAKTMAAGLHICVRTTGHNYAFLKVTALDRPVNTDDEMKDVTFTVTVWKQ